MLRDYPVYIFDEPTRGVDIGAKVDIYEEISALARSGAAADTAISQRRCT